MHAPCHGVYSSLGIFDSLLRFVVRYLHILAHILDFCEEVIHAMRYIRLDLRRRR